LPRHISRTGFIGFAAAAVLAPRAASGALTASGPADPDLANARLLVAVELLLLDFYARAAKAVRFGPAGRDAVARARFNEQEHLGAVSQILLDAGQTPANAGDIDFSYPSDAFGSVGSAVSLARRLERLATGAYLGAVASSVDHTLTLPLARIAASEAQHLSAFAREATGHPYAASFPDALTIEQASGALGAYTG
jgi:hypothetical protein